MDSVRYFLAVLLVAFLPPAILFWVVIHPFTEFWRRVGPRRTLFVLTSALSLCTVGLIAVRDRLVLTDYGTQPVLLALAAVLMTASVRIALRRRKYLTIRVLAGIPQLEKDGHGGELLTKGIYGRIRHPRYVEVVIGTIAYALVANYLGAYLVALATIPGVHAIVLLEERELRERFGQEYEEYCRRVPRYVPRFGGSASAT